MGTFVTLAEVLEARGSPLDEDEVWCLLLAATEALLDISRKGSTSLAFWFHLIAVTRNMYVFFRSTLKIQALCDYIYI